MVDDGDGGGWDRLFGEDVVGWLRDYLFGVIVWMLVSGTPQLYGSFLRGTLYGNSALTWSGGQASASRMVARSGSENHCRSRPVGAGAAHLRAGIRRCGGRVTTTATRPPFRARVRSADDGQVSARLRRNRSRARRSRGVSGMGGGLAPANAIRSRARTTGSEKTADAVAREAAATAGLS